MNRLGDLERKVMDALWDSENSPLTGREVADEVPDRAYTTVLTILDRLRRKGLVHRDNRWAHTPFRACRDARDLHGRAHDRGDG